MSIPFFLGGRRSQRNLFESKLQRKGDAMQQLGVTLGARLPDVSSSGDEDDARDAR